MARDQVERWRVLIRWIRRSSWPGYIERVLSRESVTPKVGTFQGRTCVLLDPIALIDGCGRGNTIC